MCSEVEAITHLPRNLKKFLVQGHPHLPGRQLQDEVPVPRYLLRLGLILEQDTAVEVPALAQVRINLPVLAVATANHQLHAGPKTRHTLLTTTPEGPLPPLHIVQCLPSLSLDSRPVHLALGAWSCSFLVVTCMEAEVILDMIHPEVIAALDRTMAVTMALHLLVALGVVLLLLPSQVGSLVVMDVPFCTLVGL